MSRLIRKIKLLFRSKGPDILDREVDDDAEPIGDREPRQEAPGGDFHARPFAQARGNGELET